MEKLSSQSYFQILVVSFSLIILTLIIFFRNKKSKSSPLNLPPGPWKLPLIGNLHQLIGHQPHRRLKDLAHKHGPDIMLMQLGELPYVVISSPEAAEQVMKTHDVAFASRPFFLATTIIFYNNKSIGFAPYEEHWRQMRKICVLELFSSKRVLSFRPIREQEVSNFIQRLSHKATTGEPVNLSAMTSTVTGSVTSRAAFGRVQELTDDFMVVLDNFSDATAGFRLSDLYPSLKLLPYLSGFKWKLEKMHKMSDRILGEIIDRHKAKRRLRVGEDHVHDDEDLVDVLLNMQENHELGVPMTMDVIKAVTLELFLAGIETSSTTIEWTMSEMIRHPRVLNKAQEEVRQVFGKNGDVKEDSLHQLKYLGLHPPIPLLAPREGREHVVLNGRDIPTKTRVIVNAWAINRDPRYWEDAEKFYPERFVDCSTDYKGNDFQFIPFGAGRRMCPGMSFGMAVVKLTLANLLFHFDWKLPSNMKPESLDMTENFGISLRKKYALHLIPILYKNKS
ncbi:Desmethyl-deoxy-podophyllotoxin synthase [Linum grandiflorum]